MRAGNLYLGPFKITYDFVNQLKLQITSNNMTRCLITKFRIFTISRIGVEGGVGGGGGGGGTIFIIKIKN